MTKQVTKAKKKSQLVTTKSSKSKIVLVSSISVVIVVFLLLGVSWLTGQLQYSFAQLRCGNAPIVALDNTDSLFTLKVGDGTRYVLPENGAPKGFAYTHYCTEQEAIDAGYTRWP